MKFNRRDANESEIIDALTQAGCDVVGVERQPFDIVVGRAGRTYLLEVKTAKGKLKVSQIKFRETWRGHYAIVRTVDDALRAVGLSTPADTA